MSPDILRAISAKFKAMSDPLRLSILQSLMAGEKSVGQICDEVASSQPNVSKHLSLLDQAEFIARRKVGVTVYYRIVDPSVFKICDLMCSRLQDELAASAREIKRMKS